MKTENSCYNCPNRKEACHDNCEAIRLGKPSISARKRKKRKRGEPTTSCIIGAKIDVHGILRTSMLQFQQIKRCGLFCEKERHGGVWYRKNRKRQRSEK